MINNSKERQKVLDKSIVLLERFCIDDKKYCWRAIPWYPKKRLIEPWFKNQGSIIFHNSLILGF